MAFLMAWSLYGYVLPAYADEIGSAVNVIEGELASGGGSPKRDSSVGESQSSTPVVTQDEADGGSDAGDMSAEGDVLASVATEVESNASLDATDADAAQPVTTQPQDVYVDGRIHVANLAQLEAIGTGAAVTSADKEDGRLGQGETVADTTGAPVTYSLEAAYYLEGDIEIPADGSWTFPEGFAGSFTGPDGTDGTRVYDEASDTIFVENPYQLDILTSEGRSVMPVMTGDGAAETFGSGQFVYKANGDPVNYDTSHRYVLSAAFTAVRGVLAMLESQASEGNEGLVDGRDYFGQVTKEIDGTTYILIGDRQQLDAINNAGATSATQVKVCKPLYKVVQTRTDKKIGHDWDEEEGAQIVSVELVYPGDADLVDGITTTVDGEAEDFSSNKLYGHPDTKTSKFTTRSDKDDYPAPDVDGDASYTRTVWCTIDDTTGEYDLDNHTSNQAGMLTYTRDGNYIVFRDIDMTKGCDDYLSGYVTSGSLEDGDWKPLMFEGTMYGAKATNRTEVGTLWSFVTTMVQGGSSTEQRPTISKYQVTARTQESHADRMDLDNESGVGFFGTITGKFNSSDILTDPARVQNIRLADGSVTNSCVRGEVDTTVVSGLLTALGKVLGKTLEVLLKALTGKEDGFNIEGALTSLLNARAQDPTALATGAFAGRIIADTTVKDCEADDVSVTAAATEFETKSSSIFAGESDKSIIVGTGGFVGHVEGETRYSNLSGILGATVDLLADALNLIPGLGLGDLIQILLGNALAIGDLIPTGYVAPKITNCVVNSLSLNAAEGKVGVGGFAGSVVGTRLDNCSVKESTLAVSAALFGGGFVGVARDAVIQTTLSGLKIDGTGSGESNTALSQLVKELHPQTELVSCSIQTCMVTVSGGSHLGGFAGDLANSYLINASVDEASGITVQGTGDYAAGCVGRAQLGSIFSLGDHLVTSADLLSTVTGLVTGLLGDGGDQTLLDIGGVSPSAIVGVQVLGTVEVSSEGDYVGGLLGHGQGTYIASSDDLTQLKKYSGSRPADCKPEVTGRGNALTQLKSVTGKNYVGGLAGYLTTANVGGLLGETVGIGRYLGFSVLDTTVSGVEAGGYTAKSTESYAAGGIGWAVGGTVEDVQLSNVALVEATDNYAGGFVGATGPGDLANVSGINLQLFGISLLKATNLLSIAQGVRTTYERANVSGISTGLEVVESGAKAGSGDSDFTSGGWAGTANSVRIVDSHVSNLKSVTANMSDGLAGGYVGSSSAGGLASVAEDTELKSVIKVSDLVDAVPYLVPSYDGCSVTYVDGGFVQGDTAGGFAGEFQSGKVNTYVADGTNPIKHVKDADGKDTTELESYNTYSKGTSSEPWSVYNLSYVHGGSYAGGWGGNVYSGALVSAGGGLSVLGSLSLSISATQLLSVASVYVPIVTYAGVNTKDFANNPGLKVFAAHVETDGQPATKGYAGGFIGYGSGVQVSYCDVDKLRYGSVSEPTALTNDDTTAYARIGMQPDELESSNGSAYLSFGSLQDDLSNVPYAVAGATYAGGFIGHMNVGSAASVGGGLQLLGNDISLTNILNALSAVVSTIEHSDVHGATGGFSVLASSHVNLGDGAYDGSGVGYAGGYVGKISGGHIQDGNVDNFAYVIGEVAAGGYAGEMEPGSVADLLKDESTISFFKDHLQVADLSNVASLVQDFVPTVRNSETTCIPCGGAVRAQSTADQSSVRGMAGGYVGHNKGGQIWGDNTDRWNGADYTGETRECAAIRIRSVYGQEYAGGFCGLMECGSTAQTGGLSLLGGLIDVSNLLGALQVVYPTVEHASVYGPLHGITEDTWNGWKVAVGSQGGFASELANASYSDLSSYEYGTHVVAGRHTYDANAQTKLAGTAGGFVGSMHGGVIREQCHAEDAKLVLGMRAAGGFAGEMQTKGLAEFGSVDLFGLFDGGISLNLGSLINVADVFVPAISTSGTTGYQKGLRVAATGVADDTDAARQAGVGCAGGFVGASYGGQIGIKDEAAPAAGATTSGTWVRKLKEVRGTRDVGGFVGRSSAASVLTADTENASDGFLQKLLDSLISTPGDLADVLNATIATIKYAEVTASDSTWGIVVDGSYTEDGQTKYAEAAGGFAGSLEASILGKRRDDACTLKVEGLRGVVGGYYAGGFFGLADVGSVASVGGASGSGTTSILNLIQAGNISVLDAFRTYVYHASVTGVADGIRVYAHDKGSTGVMSTYTAIGSAGGFGGGLMNGTVEDSSVTGLNHVEAPYYAAGFVGYMGKGGGVTAGSASITDSTVAGKLLSALGLNLNLNAQVLDIVGSTVSACTAAGFVDGFETVATDAQAATSTTSEADVKGSCAAGFAGYADVSQIEDCKVTGYKLAQSPQIAAGFLGRGSVAYAVDLDANSKLTEVVVGIVNTLLRALYLGGDQAENINLVNLKTENDLFGLSVLAEGDLLSVSLFGLKISVGLSKNDPEYGGAKDAAIITIGSSTIKLPCTQDGGIDTSDNPNLTINLIEANRTMVKNSSVAGIEDGYDVLGGGATQTRTMDESGTWTTTEAEGTDSLGYAGGFVAYNDNGYFSHDSMTLCDVVLGTSGLVGPFSAHTDASSRTAAYLEGGEETSGYKYGQERTNDNTYPIYRSYNADYSTVVTSGGTEFGSASYVGADGTSTGTTWNRYDVTHRSVIKSFSDLEGAQQTGDGGSVVALGAYASAAKAVLMDDTPITPNTKGDTVEPDDLKDPCDERITLTVNKVWKGDLANIAGTRPENGVTVYVWQVDAGTTPSSELVTAGTPEDASAATYATLQLTSEANAQDHTEAWKAQLTDLPVAYHPTDAEGNATSETHYYHYYVSEVEVSQYTTTYEVQQDTASVTVTNRYKGFPLPDLGGQGAGIWFLVLVIAGALAIAARLWHQRRSRDEEVGGADT